MAIVIPLTTATAFISTGRTGDRHWFWQNPLPQGNSLNAQSYLDANRGWAVGSGGTVLRTVDGAITWQALDASTHTDLWGTSFPDANFGWIVGNSGLVKRTSDGGSSWTTQTVPLSANFRAVDFIDSNRGVAVGAKASGVTTSTILYTMNGGVTWRRAAAASTADLSGVSMASDVRGYAVGANGTVLRTMSGGASWSIIPGFGTASMNAVAAARSATQTAYVVGNAVSLTYTVYKTTDGGASWTKLVVPGTGSSLLGVGCSADGQRVTVAGQNGALLHSSDGGATWTDQSQFRMVTPVSYSLRAVSQINSTVARACGDLGIVLRTADSGTLWTAAQAHTSSNLLAAVLVDANNGYAVGEGGAVLRTTDGGRSWTSNASGAGAFRSVAAVDSQRVWAVGDAGHAIRTSDGVNWTALNTGTASRLNGVWFANATNGWAVGTGGTIVRTTDSGNTWVPQSSGTSQTLNAVWFSNATIGWAVGQGGTVVKTIDGGVNWSAAAAAVTTENLSAVSGLDASTVWAVGANGEAIATADGTNWISRKAAVGTARNLYGVDFSDASHGWIVGDYGVVKVTTDGGTTWTTQSAGLPTAAPSANYAIRGVSVASNSAGLLVGAAPAGNSASIIRTTSDGGANWDPALSGTVSHVNSLQFTNATTGWAAAHSGVVLRTRNSGGSWQVLNAGVSPSVNLLDIAMVDGSTGWVAGSQGVVRRTTNSGSTWAVQDTGVTSDLITAVSAADATNAVIGMPTGALRYTTNAGASWAVPDAVNGPATVAKAAINDLYSVPNSSTVWAATAFQGAGIHSMLKSVDYGRNWDGKFVNAPAAIRAITFVPGTSVGYAVGNEREFFKSTDGGETWTLFTTPLNPLAPAGVYDLYDVAFADINTGRAVGTYGTILRTSDGGTTWTLQSSGAQSRTLRTVAMTDQSHGWIGGDWGTILSMTGDTTPTTAYAVTPASPDGASGWYKSTPYITLSTDYQADSWYSWSESGPFVPYSSMIPAAEGTQTLYFYSVNPSGVRESTQTATFRTDYTAPIAPGVVAGSSASTNTVDLLWTAGVDGVSGISHYEVYVDGSFATSSTATTASVGGLSPNTSYLVTVLSVDNAGNKSSGTSAWLTTADDNLAPLTTSASVWPLMPDGQNDWYVTTPTVSLSYEPTSATGTIHYAWEDPAAGTTYTVGLEPALGEQTLWYYSSADGRPNEATKSVTVRFDPTTPDAPTVVAGTSPDWSNIVLTWTPPVAPQSAIAYYRVFMNGEFVGTTTSPSYTVYALAPATSYTFHVTAVSGAGAESADSGPAVVTTSISPSPNPPAVVYAHSPIGNAVYVNWSISNDTSGVVAYRVWRSTNGVDYLPVALVSGDLGSAAFIDTVRSSSTRYWYAVSTLDARGESALSDTSTAAWDSIATTTGVPPRPGTPSLVSQTGALWLQWAMPADPAVTGYQVLRAAKSQGTFTTMTAAPIAATNWVDSSAEPGVDYWYRVVAVNASGVVGYPSIEFSAKFEDTTSYIADPHGDTMADEDECAACHRGHTGLGTKTMMSADPTPSVLASFGPESATSAAQQACLGCHNGTAASNVKAQVEATPTGSRFAIKAGTNDGNLFCGSCHASHRINQETSDTPLVYVNGVTYGNDVCYQCHGDGSLMGGSDMTVFEGSVHNDGNAVNSKVGIVCLNCHVQPSSPNDQLLRYTGYMTCMQCHTGSTSDAEQPDMLSSLFLSDDPSSRHPLTEQDQASGARMECQNCHNTHVVTAENKVVDPYDPSPGGVWTEPMTQAASFCFRCHGPAALPSESDTTSWAAPVLGSGGATHTTDIESVYSLDIHGSADTTNSNLRLRFQFGYLSGDDLDCLVCHRTHGSANANALKQNIASKDGLVEVNGLAVAPVSGGGYDYRFLCSSCHDLTPQSHAAVAPTSTPGNPDLTQFPVDCSSCHFHGAQNNRF